MRKTGLLAILAAAALAIAGPSLAASGGGHGSSGSQGGDGHGSSDHSEVMFAIGEPGNRAKIDRRILILAKDRSFAPQELAVHAGETIKFVVSNVDDERHAFVLGTPSEQLRAETDFNDLSDSVTLAAKRPNRLILSPGETGVLVWQFPERLPAKARSLPLFGCHIGDHFRNGQRGEIVMQPPRSASAGSSGGH